VPAGGGGGGGGMTDIERQNFLLSMIYQSKAFVGYRRLVDLFADGFKGSDGINAGSSSNYSLDTTNGRVSPTSTASTSYANTGGSGNRTASITASSTVTITGGTANSLIDGTKTGAGPAFFANSQTSGALTWDFGSGNAQFIDEIKIYLNSSTAGTNGTWAWEASNDNSSWTTIVSNFALTFTSGGDQSLTVPVSGATQTYRYWRMRLNGGTATTSAPYVDEIEFKLSSSAPAPAAMTLVTTAQTTDAARTKGRILIEYDDACGTCNAVTLNTDLTAEVTCNGGTNWASATLSSVTAYSGGSSQRKVAETADTTVTSGSSCAARLKTLNNKFLYIYGATNTVH